MHDQNSIDWSATWFCLYSVPNHRTSSTSFGQNNALTLATRLILDKLSLLTKLQTNQLSLYKEEWNCPLCGNEKQTWDHLWLCPILTNKFAALLDFTHDTLIQRLLANDHTP